MSCRTGDAWDRFVRVWPNEWDMLVSNWLDVGTSANYVPTPCYFCLHRECAILRHERRLLEATGHRRVLVGRDLPTRS